MDVYINSEIGECNQFIPEGSSEKQTVSIVISPLRVEMKEEENQLKIISGCSMFTGCQNKDCYFSIAARKEPKIINPGK